jgi:hypothetical protein
VANLPIPELVENRRRSIAMLPAGAPALNRYEALEVLRQLVDALEETQGVAAPAAVIQRFTSPHRNRRCPPIVRIVGIPSSAQRATVRRWTPQ